MSGLFRRGKPGEGVFLIYAAQRVGVGIDLGIGQDSQTQEMYPTIDLEYHEKVHLGVLSIAQEMTQNSQFPKVHLVNRGAYLDVSVVFHLKCASRGLLNRLIPDSVKEQAFEEMGDERVAVVTIAETEFPIRSVRPFLIPFRRGPNFRVHIVTSDGGQRQAVWGVILNSYDDEPPNVTDLIP